MEILKDRWEWHHSAYKTISTWQPTLRDDTYALTQLVIALNAGATVEFARSQKVIVIDYFTYDGILIDVQATLPKWVEAATEVLRMLPSDPPPHLEITYNRIRDTLEFQARCFDLLLS